MREPANLDKLTYFLKINERMALSVGYPYFMTLCKKKKNILKIIYTLKKK